MKLFSFETTLVILLMCIPFVTRSLFATPHANGNGNIDNSLYFLEWANPYSKSTFNSSGINKLKKSNLNSPKCNCVGEIGFTLQYYFTSSPPPWGVSFTEYLQAFENEFKMKVQQDYGESTTVGLDYIGYTACSEITASYLASTALWADYQARLQTGWIITIVTPVDVLYSTFDCDNQS